MAVSDSRSSDDLSLSDFNHEVEGAMAIFSGGTRNLKVMYKISAYVAASTAV